MGNLEKIKNYFKEVKVEMSKVEWPSKDTTIKYTLIVIGVSAATAVFLSVLDYLFGLGLDIFLFR